MTDMVKRCHHLHRDNNGGWACWSSHVCYRRFCLRDMFETVYAFNGRLRVIKNNNDYEQETDKRRD